MKFWDSDLWKALWGTIIDGVGGSRPEEASPLRKKEKKQKRIKKENPGTLRYEK